MKIKDIIKESEKIDIEKTSQQVLQWVCDNVEQFIDNQKRTFKLDLFLGEESDDTGQLSELKKLQDLYLAVPDVETISDESLSKFNPELTESDYGQTLPKLTDEEEELIESASETRRKLDKITNGVFDDMQKQTELLETLFKRMVFYYELKGISQGVPLIEELEGGVEVLQFEYEAFSVDVKVSKPAIHKRDQDGNLEEVEEEAQTEYTIPEGFTIWVEISYKPKSLGLTSLF